MVESAPESEPVSAQLWTSHKAQGSIEFDLRTSYSLTELVVHWGVSGVRAWSVESFNSGSSSWVLEYNTTVPLEYAAVRGWVGRCPQVSTPTYKMRFIFSRTQHKTQIDFKLKVCGDPGY